MLYTGHYMIHNAKERTYKCTSIFAYKKLYRNSLNTQKRQFENGISESIFCVYACVGIFCLEKGFALKFSPVIQ